MTALAARLRDIFASTREQEDEVIEDERRLLSTIKDLVPAAVLVPIIDAPEPRVLLTVRHAGLRNHAGQIAFPGGRIDPDDASPAAAALREAWEEVGLPSDQVDVIGRSGLYRTGTGYEITPIVGVIPEGIALNPQEAEVSDIFEVPLAHIFDPKNQIEKTGDWRGMQMPYHEIMWHDYRIWGVTAGLIVRLSRRIGSLL